MKRSFDVYVLLRKRGKVHSTASLRADERVIIDYDEKKRIIGVEIIDAPRVTIDGVYQVKDGEIITG